VPGEGSAVPGDDSAVRGELKFGVLFNGDPRRAARLERRGVDSLWVGGHIAAASPTAEALTALARMSAVTERVLLGTSVLLLPLYPPAIVAKAAADLDRVTGGRVILGVGVGGESPQEYRACGVPRETRGRRMDEAIPLLRRLWTAEPVTHEGRYYPMSDVRIHPAPAQPGGPPIVVAGRRDPALRRAALLGDGWMPYLYSPGRYAASVAAITETAAAAGRDLARFGWYAMIFVNVSSDRDAARAAAAGWLTRTYGQDFPVSGDRMAAGDVADVTSRLLAYADAGVRHFILCVAAGHDSATSTPPESEAVVAALTEQVVPAVRAAWQRRHRPDNRRDDRPDNRRDDGS
jgi:probable F420-dependent oxidoreductase